MATNNKNFVVKNGLIVGNSTNLVNYTTASPLNPFIGQLWISASTLYSWSGSSWLLLANGDASSASGTFLNIPNTLVARSASGSFQIGAVDFHTASPASVAVGRITWDDGSGTAFLGLKGGNINLPIGQEENALVYNGTGSALARGQVIRITGAQGQRPRIDLASAINDANSSKTFGIVAEPIIDGAEGFVTTFGIVSNINTANFIEGASLWLSPSAGGIVSTMPIQPYHNVFLGYCLKSHASAGKIFVKIQNGYEIEELHDVLVQTASNNQILSYNSASSLWMNKDLQAAIKEVDGIGSGIDADLLDGQNGSYFLNTSSATQEKTGNITFHGTLTVNELVVSGSSTFIATQDLSVTDSIIFLASEQYTTDTLDIGFIGSYGDGTTSSAAHYHASFARDASQNKWKLLSNGPAPVNNIIDYSDPSVEYGVLQVGAVEVSSSAKVNNLNADLLDDQNGSYYLDWTNTTNKPGPIIAVSLSGNTTAAASVTLTNLTNGQISLVTNTAHSTAASSMNWSGVTSKPSPIVGVNLTGNTTGAASATLTQLANGQISIITNTAHAGTASSIAGSLVTGTVNNASHANTASSITGLLITGPVASANFSLFANSASSINASLITGTTLPAAIINSSLTSVGTLTNLSVTNVISGRIASANFSVHSLTASSIAGSLVTGIVNNANHANTASSIAGSLVIGTVNNALHSNTASSIAGLLVTGPVASANFSLFANSASSINWSLITNRPSASPALNPQIGINLIGSVTGAASAILTNLNNAQITITTTGGGSASSVDWSNVTNKPGPIIGINLNGIVTGAASGTLTDLTNSQISITTQINTIINPISSSPTYNLSLTDAGELIELNHSSSVRVIIPLNSTVPFPIGTTIDILQTGVGQVTASYVSGVTLNSNGNAVKLNGQWSAASLIKRQTDTWVLIGDITV